MKVYVVYRITSSEYCHGDKELDIKFITSSSQKANCFIKENPRYSIIEKLFTPKKYHLDDL